MSYRLTSRPIVTGRLIGALGLLAGLLAVTATPASAANYFCGGFPATKVGSHLIVGTSARDVIVALGDDFTLILGGEGDDIICGNAGPTQIEGQDGNDTIYGGGGDDEVYGQAGEDWLYGGAGNDTMNGALGIDHVFGQDGNDYLEGGAQIDYLYGGTGNDFLHDAVGANWLDCGPGYVDGASPWQNHRTNCEYIYLNESEQ